MWRRSQGSRPLALLTDAPFSVAPVAGEIDVKMIVMVAIGIWAQDRGELLTGPTMDGAQEQPLAFAAPPPRLDIDGATVSERKGGNIKRIGVAVLGQSAA